MKKQILLFSLILFFSVNAVGKKKIIIDADTANELDDMVAIARVILAEDIEIAGLTAAQWNNEGSWMRNTVKESWELNNKILQSMSREDIPSLIGSEQTVGIIWEGDNIMGAEKKPRESEAARFIIQMASEIPEGEKITILALGALTNIASAILLKPAIAGKISLYYIGTLYDLDENVWNKNEFNTRNDLNALDVILNTANLELHVLPANVAEKLAFENKSSIERLKGECHISSLIRDRWMEMVPEPTNDRSWVMWDLALVHAIMNPEWTKKIATTTPPENVQRQVMVYTWIDTGKMIEDFWNHFSCVRPL